MRSKCDWYQFGEKSSNQFSFLITVDTEKAFDSINHCFLTKLQKNFGFEIRFYQVD